MGDPEVGRVRPIIRRGPTRRSAWHRLALRLPRLTSLLLACVDRVPPGSKLWRRVVTRYTRDNIEALNRGDIDAMLIGYEPDFEYILEGDWSQVAPDYERVYHGHEGFRSLVRTWEEAWGDAHWDAEEFIYGRGPAAGLLWIETTGRGSGATTRQRLGMTYELRRGKCVRQRQWHSWEAALEWFERERGAGDAGPGAPSPARSPT